MTQEAEFGKLYTDPVTTEDLMALDLPPETVGSTLIFVWPYLIETMNGVLAHGREPNPAVAGKTSKELINDVGGYGEFPKDLESSRDVFAEIVIRLAEIPLNSDDIVTAHSLANGVSWARDNVIYRLGLPRDAKPTLATIIGS